jgi:hypothetical protein
MSSEPIKLMRIPINTNCAIPECNKKISMGAYAYFIPDTNDTICIECGTKRGWTSKQRATMIIQELEIREDIKALRKQRQIDSNELLHVKEQTDLFKLEMREYDLHKQAINLIALIDDYLKKCGSAPAEKAMFDKAVKAIQGSVNLQKEVKQEIATRLFLLERVGLKRKKKGLIATPIEDEEEQQQEEPIPQ